MRSRQAEGSTADSRTTRAQRRGRKPGLWPLLMVLAAVAVSALVFFATSAYRTWSQSADATRSINEATTLIERADTVVVAVDAVIGAEMSAEVASSAAQVAPRVAEAAGLLREAVQTIDEVSPSLDDGERRRASALGDAARARLDMLSQAPSILSATAKAATALPLATTAWSEALAADKTTKRAVAAYNKLTKTGVRESRRLNQRAAVQLAAARDGMSRAEQAFPEATFETYLAYLDARIELNRLSQRSDAAWLKGEFEKANTAIAAYNERDKRTVAQAKGLSASPAKVIADAYEAAATASTDEYYSARDRATQADARVRRF